MPKYKHKYTTFSNIIVSLGLFLVNFIQLLNPNCYEAGLIGLSISTVQYILELPTITKHCSTRCSKLYEKLDNKYVYLFKFILYNSMAVGIGFIYNIYSNCSLLVLNMILLIAASILYLASFIMVCRQNDDDSKFSNFKSPNAKNILSGLRSI